MEQKETDLYLIHKAKTDYWKEKIQTFNILAKILLTSFVLLLIMVSFLLYTEFSVKYILPTLVVGLLFADLVNIVGNLAVYQYFFKQRNRAKFYKKYMNNVLLAFSLSLLIVIVISLTTLYISKYFLLSLIFLPIFLLYFILLKYKKLKLTYLPLPHLSLEKALYREKCINEYVYYVLYEQILSRCKVEDMTLIYYYLNVFLYDNNIELVSLEDKNFINKVFKIANKHIQYNNNQNLYEEIELRAILLKEKFTTNNFEDLLDEFFA